MLHFHSLLVKIPPRVIVSSYCSCCCDVRCFYLIMIFYFTFVFLTISKYEFSLSYIFLKYGSAWKMCMRKLMSWNKRTYQVLWERVYGLGTSCESYHGHYPQLYGVGKSHTGWIWEFVNFAHTGQGIETVFSCSAHYWMGYGDDRFNYKESVCIHE